MTSIFDALTQLFTRWGIGLRYVQWCVAGVLGGYVGLAVLSVFLSSWGFQWLIWIFVAFYVFGVINLMASPFLWGGVAGAAYVRGQAGGQEGLSIEDGINTVQDWGTKAIKGTAKFLLFYGAVPFIWTALFQTKGWEQENLVVLILLPTVIYFSLVRWPNSQSVFNTIGYVLIAVVLVGILGTIYNTVSRKIVDPATLEVQAYEEKLTKDQQTFEAELARDLRKKVEAKKALTAEEAKAWATIRNRAHAQSNASRVQALVTTVADAKPTDARWWKEHWYLPAGAIAIIVLALWWFGRTTTGTAGATPTVAGAHASAETTNPVVKVLQWSLLLSVVGYLGWSIYNEEGWPGEYIAEATYTHHDTVEITSLADQRMCLPGLKSGNWYLSYPDEVMKEHRYNGQLKKTAGFYAAWPGGQQQLSFTESVWINGVRSSVDEKVHVEPGGCFTITPKVAQAIKGVAVIYGNPRCATPDTCVRSTTPVPAQLNIFFSGRKVPLR